MKLGRRERKAAEEGERLTQEEGVEAVMGSVEPARISAQSFPTLPSARIEFNINASGLHIVANRAGWETLGMWCARMERAATEDHDDAVMARSPFELDPDVAPSEMLADGSIMTAFWGLGANPTMRWTCSSTPVIRPDHRFGPGLASEAAQALGRTRSALRCTGRSIH